MKGDKTMGNEKNRLKELRAEQELEEALDDRSLSAEERTVIEEQLRIIRRKYLDMVESLKTVE